MRAAVGLALVLGLSDASACSNDMQDQPSYHSQEAPRKHSPEGSVPRTSRAVMLQSVGRTAGRLQQGARIFGVNCMHCHGPQGDGDGPVAGYLIEQPANLRSPKIQSKPEAEIYKVVTNGKEKRMPAFKGLLSAEERWAVAHYVKALGAVR
jgi:cytochrome c